MTEREIETKLAELDRILNDPDTRMDPHKVWTLLAELQDKRPRAPAPASAA
ncbi:peptide chain release factor 1 [Roseomonas sp. AR75]|uniref:peptide chain release factor 1 n=1 Tax=Roseomonas sp. AR75 TaxID=2562311 RepID=UPI0010BFCB39|nr:peptide chain release factor 1 [Roseomonas sp. AR75]